MPAMRRDPWARFMTSAFMEIRLSYRDSGVHIAGAPERTNRGYPPLLAGLGQGHAAAVAGSVG
jgi:hypothetical protein